MNYYFVVIYSNNYISENESTCWTFFLIKCLEALFDHFHSTNITYLSKFVIILFFLSLHQMNAQELLVLAPNFSATQLTINDGSCKLGQGVHTTTKCCLQSGTTWFY